MTSWWSRQDMHRPNRWQDYTDNPRHNVAREFSPELFRRIHLEGILWVRQFEPDELVNDDIHSGTSKGPNAGILPFTELELAVKAWVDGDQSPLLRYIVAHPKCRWAKRVVKSMTEKEAMC